MNMTYIRKHKSFLWGVSKIHLPFEHFWVAQWELYLHSAHSLLLPHFLRFLYDPSVQMKSQHFPILQSPSLWHFWQSSFGQNLPGPPQRPPAHTLSLHWDPEVHLSHLSLSRPHLLKLALDPSVHLLSTHFPPLHCDGHTHNVQSGLRKQWSDFRITLLTHLLERQDPLAHWELCSQSAHSFRFVMVGFLRHFFLDFSVLYTHFPKWHSSVTHSLS